MNLLKNILIGLLLAVSLFFVFRYKQQKQTISTLRTEINGLPANTNKIVTIEKTHIQTVYRDANNKTKVKSEYAPPEGKIQITYKTDPTLKAKYEALAKEKYDLEDKKIAIANSLPTIQLDIEQKETLIKQLEEEKQLLLTNQADPTLIKEKEDQLNSLQQELITLNSSYTTSSSTQSSLLDALNNKNTELSNLRSQLLEIEKPEIKVQHWGFTLYNPQLSLVYKASPIFTLDSLEPSLSNRFFFYDRIGAGLGISISQAYLFADYRLDQIYLKNTTIGAYIGKDWQFNTTWGIKASVFM